MPLAVGTVFTFLSIWLSGRNANKNARRQNDLAAKLKLAEFRQKWINDLREAMSEFQAGGLVNKYETGELKELYRLAARIRLMMNNKDPEYGSLSNSIDVLLLNANEEGRIKLVRDLIPVMQKILKTEWEVLKRDLSYEAPIEVGLENRG